ncbi:MAG: tetratricopeptide repeat protein [Nitrospirae bacterium]|nr:tetratricopeptide repeat protein [Nitrospirota bacterium]
MKKIIFFFFICIIIFPHLCSGEISHEEQLNKGIKNSEPYSYLLIEKSRTNSTEAKSLLEKSLHYSPDLPAVYFELSKASFHLNTDGIFESIDYIIQGISAYKRNFWWMFSLVTSLYVSLIFSFLISILVIIIIRLPKDISLVSHDIKEEKSKILLLFILIFAIFGPLYVLGGLLILISFYMKKWDRLVAYFYLLFLLAAIWIFDIFSIGFIAPASGDVKAVIQVNESKGNSYAISVLQNKNNPIELFSYALALKREGHYSEAINIYNKVLNQKTDPKTYNNLANCYTIIGDFEKAKELYQKSIELVPLASTLYNLSQVYRETLNFEKGDKYFVEAQKLDREAVSRFREIFSRNPNRFVIDEVIPMQTLMEYTLGKATGSFTMGLSIAPASFMPVIAIVMAVIFYIITGRFRNRAYRCNRCGKILCIKCEKHIHWGNMCSQCYRSIIKLDELESKERIARLLKVYEFRKKKREIIKILTLIIPGSGQIYAGDLLNGILFLWPFLFFLFIPITGKIFNIEMFNFSHFWLNIISIFLLILVYFLSNIITRRRLSKGWL